MLTEILAVWECPDGAIITLEPNVPFRPQYVNLESGEGVLLGFVQGEWTQRRGQEPFICKRIFAESCVNAMKIREYFSTD